MTPDMFEILKQQEGFRSHIYEDTVGVPTIGYGTNLKDGITEAQASLLARCEVTTNRMKLLEYDWFLILDSVRQDVIENMAYNMGIDGVLGFHMMINAIERMDWEAAADQMLNSEWAGQVGQRAVALAAFMRTGKINNAVVAT